MLPRTPPKGALLLAGLLLVPFGDSPRAQRPAQEATPGAAGAQEQAPASHELYESARVEFSAPPPTVVQAGVQCDGNGNIYLIYGASLQVIYPLLRKGVSLPVSKLSLDSKSVVQFPMGQFQGYAEYSRPSFYVAPRGNMYGLVVAYPHERGYEGSNWPDSMIVKYKDDGTVDSITKLEPPAGEHVSLWSFAAFPDGNFLVTGAVLSPNYMPTEPLTGIFDRSGAFVGPIELPHDVRPQNAESAPSKSRVKTSAQAGSTSGAVKGGEEEGALRPWLLSVQQGLMQGSPDGSIYLLRATDPARLYAISSTGTVLRDIEVKPPEPGLQPVQMSLAGQNGLLLKFSPTRSSQHPQSRESLALFDLGAGKITDTYHLPPNASGLSACAAPRDEFLFLGTSKQGQFEVVRYAAR
ncbi:MAG: hypothetical protein DMG25_06175 [Acidobacteria bacterium]|nr:MAG: hypothetical protein DMG25_06175 [Acidobacteriota bacterium]